MSALIGALKTAAVCVYTYALVVCPLSSMDGGSLQGAAVWQYGRMSIDGFEAGLKRALRREYGLIATSSSSLNSIYLSIQPCMPSLLLL